MKPQIKKAICCLLTASALSSFTTMVAAAQPVAVNTQNSVINPSQEQYTLVPGTELQLTVFGHPELSTPPNATISQYIVRPDGNLSFPLLGTIAVQGLTIEQLQSKLTKEFAQYIKNPNVAINIKKLGTTRVYVLGEVRRSGMYELTKSHRVLDAIGAAEGFTEKSAKKKIYLIRRGSNTPELININDYFLKGDQSQNVVLNEGDTIYFSGNGKIDIVRDVLPFISSAYYVTRFDKD